jgi:hypothetical protein
MSLILILVICGIVFLGLSIAVLVVQQYRINKKIITLDESYNGPAEVSVTLHAVIRYILRRSVYFRKFFMQYMFHAMVRVMYYIDTWSSLLYAKSRNWFVENAVRNRGTVPHFWHHLKVYKQEMDQEKEGNEDKK